jgi:hypothetical protein
MEINTVMASCPAYPLSICKGGNPLTKRSKGAAWIAAGCVFIIPSALIWSYIQSRSNLIAGVRYSFGINGLMISDTALTFILASAGAICLFLGIWNLTKDTKPSRPKTEKKR